MQLPSVALMRIVLPVMLVMVVGTVMRPIPVAAQITAPFLFTVPQPDASLRVGDGETSTAIGERSLLLFSGAAFDPGLSIEARSERGFVVRSSIGTVDFTAGGQRFRSFQQLEILRSIRSTGRAQLAIGGGVRQDWGGAQTFVGRVIAGARIAGGRLEGNAVIEKGNSGRAGHRDAFDVITTIGWSRAVTDRIALGVEGIGHDLEGFWERDEAEGGARLLIGPSIRVASPGGRWSFGIAGGPLLHSPSTVEPTTLPRAIPETSSRSHFAVLGSLTCVLSSH
jgi:hypothetical protein